jgi:hypothetical protein
MDPVTCRICGFKKPAKTEDDAYLKSQKEKSGPPRDRFNRLFNKADSVVAYLLGYKTVSGVNEPQLDMYSGVTGYHIRTIPGKRWTNPVLVGAGGGYLAIVDRCDTYDVIRITDEYCGLDEGDFNEYGLPKDSIDLEHIEDMAQVITPTGSHVTGLTILPRGVLIANLDTSAPSFIKADVWAILDGKTQPGYAGVQIIEEPFDTLGPLTGAPARFDLTISDEMHYFVGMIDGGVGNRGIVIANLLNGLPYGYVGLPDEYTPLAVTQGQGIVHVLVQETATKVKGTSVGTKVLRLPIVEGSFMFTLGGGAANYLPDGQDYAVSHTYPIKDSPSEKTDISGDIEGARRINFNFAPDMLGTEITAGMVETRLLTDGKTSQELAPRTQSYKDLAHTTYGDGRHIDVTMISIPEGINVYDLESFANVLVEGSFKLDKDGEIDTGVQFFTAFHSSHYDYLSDGGWMYGCSVGDDPGLTNNGLIPLDIAIDNLINPGSLKDPPDLTPVLVDNLTGKILYRDPKPGVGTTYDGQFASAALATSNKIIRTGCSDLGDNAATILDGISRPGLRSRANDSFDGDLDFDKPCEYYDRHVAPRVRFADVTLAQNSWTRRESDGVTLLADWSNQTDPVSTSKTSIDVPWPHNGTDDSTPKFETSVGGGYWFLDLIKERTTKADELRLDIQELVDTLATIPVTNTGALETLNTQITEKKAELASIDESDSEQNPIMFKTPRTVLKQVHKIEPRVPQTIDPVTGLTNITAIDPVVGSLPLTPWTDVPVRVIGAEVDDTKQSGIVVDPGIRSWIGITIRANYWGVYTDGVAAYVHDETYENGLGLNVGKAPGWDNLALDNAYDNPFRIYPASSYEAGFTASEGAYGLFKVTIKANGRPIKEICTKVSYLEQLDQAPIDIADILAGDMNYTAAIDNGLARGYAYFSSELVETVTIKVQLINYARGVYRYGMKTVDLHTGGTWERGCPQYDPGWFEGNNCEALGCGNVGCASFIFSGNKLYADDPVLDETHQLIWEGEATYTFDGSEREDYAVGRYLECFFNFDLMAPISGYKVDIRSNH